MEFIPLGILLLVSCVCSIDWRIDPLVSISQGLLRGQRAADGDYTTFLGIPYAEVDHDNPFGPALPPRAFGDEIFKASDNSAVCPQTQLSWPLGRNTDTQTLDCLKLSIYVPNEATSQNPLPVLVWIHGGVFAVGSGREYSVNKLVKQGIIVVTINYRLGPYGFMCLDVPAVPGNQGLKDQYAALRWIRNNIGAFGGNPYNVTLAGQSAGACSVLLHLYSAREKLYHKLIVESGTPQNEGMFVKSNPEAAIKLANFLGLNTTHTNEALEFLSQTPHSMVTAAASSLFSELKLRPCKERSFSGVDNFVESDPYSLTNEKKIRNTPILIGHTSKEEVNSILHRPNYFESDPINDKIAKNYKLDQITLEKVSNTIRHYYIGDKEMSIEVASELEDFESDFIFNHPNERVITKLLNENAKPVYQYLFNYDGDLGATGAGHSAELKFLFDMRPLDSEDDEILSDRMVAMWTNFVKYGNPTPPNTLPFTWTPLDFNTRPYLLIDNDMRMENRVFKERMAFWDLFYDNYGSNNVLARECRI